MVLPHVVLEERPLVEGALERLDAVLVGPGLGPVQLGGQGGKGLEPWWSTLQAFSGLLVVDADGLNRIHPAWLKDRAGPTWITPHAGEFGRLWPELRALPPLEAAAEAARLSGASVLLKGARSVIAAADGRRWQLMEACGEAARAGLGDVLAGYAAGLGARLGAPSGGTPDASGLALAALDHALAGGHAAQEFGPGGATPLAVTEGLAQMPRLKRRPLQAGANNRGIQADLGIQGKGDSIR
jgi:NAD(P)H-hydrate epimerase